MKRYKINSPYVVSEVFADEEAAIINLKTGTYFSLNKAATRIWSMVEKGANFDELVAFTVSNYEVENSAAKTDLEQFVDKLVNEDLIVADGSEPASAELTLVKDAARRREYERPVLESYEDMQELLLLDPIHEVEETNWLNTGTE